MKIQLYISFKYDFKAKSINVKYFRTLWILRLELKRRDKSENILYYIEIYKSDIIINLIPQIVSFF